MNLDKKLYDAKMAVLYKKKLSAQREALLEQQRLLQKKEREMEEQLAKEEADVIQLESAGLRKYLHFIIGNYDKKLDQEKEEWREAEVRYEVVNKELQAVQKDLAKADTELNGLVNIEALYEQLMQEKIEQIRVNDPVRGEIFLQLDEQLQELENQHRELNEAILAGEQALSVAEPFVKEIDWDLSGKNQLHGYMRYEHNELANTKVNDLQGKLRKFYTELADVPMDQSNPNIMESFVVFSDHYLKCLFSERSVLHQIYDVELELRAVIKQVKQVMQKLNELTQENERQHADIQEKREALLEV